jgi:hypothetical protein
MFDSKKYNEINNIFFTNKASHILIGIDGEITSLSKMKKIKKKKKKKKSSK